MKTKKIAFIPIQDFFVLLSFFVFALIIFWGRWNGLYPFTELWTDAGVVSGFSAARVFPDHFVNDPLLGNPDTYRYYIAAHIPILIWLTKFSSDFGTSFTALFIPTIFLHLTGFYYLGKYLFKNRIFSYIFSAIILVSVYYGAWDYWGYFVDPQPRFLFQSVLPFVLLFAISRGSDVKNWSIAMVFCGLMFYFHSISGLAIAWMIWMGYLFSKPKDKTVVRWILSGVLTGFVFLLIISPFIITYLSTMGSSYTVAYDVAYPYIVKIFDTILNIRSVAQIYFSNLTQYLIIPFAIIAAFLLIKFGPSEKRQQLKLVSVWLLALFLISLIIPAIEHWIERQMEILPLQMDLVRNLRYTVPLLWIIVFSAVSLLLSSELLKSNWRQFGFLAVFACVMFGWAQYADTVSDRVGYILPSVTENIKRCISERRPICPTSYQLETKKVIDYISDETPIDSVFINVPDNRLGDAIRYAGLRALSFSSSDDSRVAFPDLELGMEVVDKTQEWKEISQIGDHAEEIDQFIDFACNQETTTHILFDNTYSLDEVKENDRVTVLFNTNSYTVTEIVSCE